MGLKRRPGVKTNVPTADSVTSGTGAGRVKVSLTEHNRRSIYIGTVVLLVIVAASIIALESVHRSPLQSCTSILLQQNKLQCLQSLAVSTRNASVCNYAAGPYRYACIAEVAEEEGNLGACEAINKSSLYYNACVYNISYSSNSLNGCELLSSQGYESECIYALAQKQNFSNAAYCDLIPNSTTKNMCIDMSYYSGAVSSGVASYCRYLPAQVNDTILYSMFTQRYATQPSIFSNASSIVLPLFYSVMNVTPQGLCYYSVAIAHKNESLCSSAGGELASMCTYNFYEPKTNLTLNTTALNVSAICANSPPSSAQYCELGLETSMAIKEDNVSRCLAISGDQFQYSCIDALAESYKSASYCSYITNSTAQQACDLLIASGANSTA
ncbi:MAG: hypothetical protein QXR58_00680 [Candidatus Micrarchaeaceae archaeon]